MTVAHRSETVETLASRAIKEARRAAKPAYRFQLIAEIANFAELRRRLGCARAELLAGLVADRVARVIPGASVAILSRTQIASGFRDADRSAIDRYVGAIEHAFERPVTIDDQHVEVRLTFGAAAAPATALDEVALVEEAENALAEARMATRASSTLRSIAASSSSTISPRSTSGIRKSAAPRLWCAGTTPSAGWSCRTTSSRSPKNVC